MHIVDHRYGKERVRLTTLDRSVSPHRLVVCAVGISLEGSFEPSFTDGDNRNVVATDSMKNTVYVLAREHGVTSIERFALLLATHFAETYSAVSSASVDIEQEVWRPIEGQDAQHAAALMRASTELYLASAHHDGTSGALSSGIDLLQVIKTADSGFSDFHRDRFATLKDTDDRLFATTLRVEWTLARADVDATQDQEFRHRVRSTLLEVFATHNSRSVQETLHAMGTAVLESIAEVAEINLQLPNQHHLLANLEPFGLDNENQVFVGTDEPFGNIEATLSRSS